MAENMFVGSPVCRISLIASFIHSVCFSRSSSTLSYQSLIYLGIDWGSSFEAAILERTRHCEIWGYDYGSHGFGSDIPKEHKHRTHFHRFGLGGTDSHGPNDDPKLYTLQSLMRLNGIYILSVPDIRLYQHDH